METTTVNDAAKRLFDKQNRTNTLLGIVVWVCLALGAILFSFGLWTHFHSVGGHFTAAYRDDTVYVEASYGKEEKILNNAELRASLVTPEDDPDAYMQKMTAAMTAIGRGGETAPTNAIYHVGFYVGDQEVEPEAPVNVVVQILQDGLFSVGQPIKVIHLGENDAKVIADTLVDDAGSVSFTTDGFSDFVFIFDSDDDQSGDTSDMEGNGIVGSGRSIADRIRAMTGSFMPNGESRTSGSGNFMTMANPSGDGELSDGTDGGEPSATSEEPIDLNELNDEDVTLTFQYKDESGTWQNVPGDKNIFDYHNSDISINFKFNKQFTQDELTQSGGTFTYDLPPYLVRFSADQEGVLKDQNGAEAGTVKVGEDGRVTIQLNDTFLQNNNSASELHFTLSGGVDLEKATEKEEGDKKYPGFNLEIPTDEREVHSRYGTLKLEKTCVEPLVPQRDEDGNWYLDYTLTVTAQDCDMPDVRVEDLFRLTSDNAGVQERLRGLIEAYDKYSVDDEDMSYDVDKTAPTDDPPADNSVYQTTKDGVPQLNWYLGDMTVGESRTLHYRVKLNQDKMEKTNFTKDGTNLSNTAEAFSQTYPKANADADLSIKTYVYVNKIAQENLEHQNSDPKVYFVPDGNGGGYIEYKVTVRNDRDYPVEVKVYDSVNDPNTNPNNLNKGKGLSYDQESFKFDPPKTEAGEEPKLEFSKEDDKYTSFTAHIGWMEPDDEVTITYRINISAEELAAGPVDVNNGVLALFERQTTTDDTYSTWLERYSQNHTVEQESWAAKNFGGEVTPGTEISIDSENVYDATGESVTKMDNPDPSFTLGENSFKYTVTVNGNTVWDVSSATMGDQLTNGLHYSGYVQVVAKDKDGVVQGTAWVKVDDLKEFSFTGKDIGFGGLGAGTSYELTYYTTVDANNENVHIVLENNFSLTGDIIGPDGNYINVSVRDSTSNRGETSNHLKVTKDAWYYEPNETTSLGAFYWIVKVDASYIPSGFALRDAAGEKHELHDDSLLGVYTGPKYDFSQVSDWAAFQTSAEANGFQKFNQYSSQFAKENGLTVTFGEDDYTPEEGAPYVYLFFKTYVTERQKDPYENKIYSNGNNIPGTEVDYLEDEAANHLPGVGGVEKMGMQVFDWDGEKITPLNGTIPGDYALDASILSGGSVHAGRYAAWGVSVNRMGDMQGDYTITDQIPVGMELAFVAIAKTVNILQQNTNNTPPYAIPLSGDGVSGLLVGHAKANKSTYEAGKSYWDESERTEWKPWTADNWKYYPSTDGRTVSWGVHIEHGMCIRSDDGHVGEPISAYEVDYLVVCRVTDPEVLLGVTKGDPQKTFNNHVTVRGDDGTVANADAQLTVPCKPVVTKDGVQDVEDGHLQQTIKFTLKVNEEAAVVEGEGDTLTLKDKMSENLILVTDSVKFYSNSACTQELTKETDGVDFTSVGNIITFTIPNGKEVYIQYECLINAPAGVQEGTPVENIVYFDGHKPDDQGETWKGNVHYDPSGGVSGSKKMQISKKDALTGACLPGAKFEVTLLGVTNDEGEYEKYEEYVKNKDEGEGEASEGETENHFTLETGEDGISAPFPPVEGGLYRIVETKAPAGYVPDSTPKYYWVGKGTFTPPTAEQAGLTEEPNPTINVRYTGVIDVEVTNERAKITVTKKFEDADGKSMSEDVTGTFTFGLFTKEGNTYKEANAAYGEREQTLTFPADKDETLTFYVPYTLENGTPVEYYILELDEAGNPMASGSRSWIQTTTQGTVQFEPSYGYKSGETIGDAASSENAVTEVTVTNTCYGAYSLPETGGPGTLVYLMAGLALILGSGLALTVRKRRRQAQ